MSGTAGIPAAHGGKGVKSLDRRLPPGFLEEALRTDAWTGLTAEPKSLPPKWFYDAQGSALFDKITELPEYYPTRAEREILRANAAGIAAQTGARTLIELGSGSSDKTRLLLDALRDAGTLRCYVPVDVSEPALTAAGKALSASIPGSTSAPWCPTSRSGSGSRPRARTAGLRRQGWSPSSAARSGTSNPGSGPPSWPGSGTGCGRVTSSCSAPTWSRTRPRWSPRTTTSRASPPSSTRTYSRC